jgi:probable HAF family extracellular repeat protein
MNGLSPRRSNTWVILVALFLISAWSTVAFAQNPVYLVTDLGVLPGYPSSQATSINNKGQVVGTLFNDTLQNATVEHAFIWSNGVVTDLTPGSGNNTRANSINNNGQVTIVGAINQANSIALWQNGVLTNLCSPPLSICQGAPPQVAFINDAGQVAYGLIFRLSTSTFTTSFLWENGLNGSTVRGATESRSVGHRQWADLYTDGHRQRPGGQYGHHHGDVHRPPRSGALTTAAYGGAESAGCGRRSSSTPAQLT